MNIISRDVSIDSTERQILPLVFHYFFFFFSLGFGLGLGFTLNLAFLLDFVFAATGARMEADTIRLPLNLQFLSLFHWPLAAGA